MNIVGISMWNDYMKKISNENIDNMSLFVQDNTNKINGELGMDMYYKSNNNYTQLIKDYLNFNNKIKNKSYKFKNMNYDACLENLLYCFYNHKKSFINILIISCLMKDNPNNFLLKTILNIIGFIIVIVGVLFFVPNNIYPTLFVCVSMFIFLIALIVFDEFFELWKQILITFMIKKAIKINEDKTVDVIVEFLTILHSSKWFYDTYEYDILYTFELLLTSKLLYSNVNSSLFLEVENNIVEFLQTINTMKSNGLSETYIIQKFGEQRVSDYEISVVNNKLHVKNIFEELKLVLKN